MWDDMPGAHESYTEPVCCRRVFGEPENYPIRITVSSGVE